ncbi:hypothetical protein BHE74_00059178 [Ensete ventricosum]|nr:hypothetical protein BHE74_00059178 [Ensete ventricosum]
MLVNSIMGGACLLLEREICSDEERVVFGTEEAEDVRDADLSSDWMTFFFEETRLGPSTKMGLATSTAQSLLVDDARLAQELALTGSLLGGRAEHRETTGRDFSRSTAGIEGTSVVGRGDPTIARKIDVDLVLILVQHDDSGSEKEEEPSLHVGEKG